jgi:hypothetical protein
VGVEVGVVFFFFLWDTFSIERIIEDKMVCSRFMESDAGE